MKSWLNKKIPLLLCSGIICTTPLSLTSLTSCSNNNTIQFANFESYMDNSLMNYLESEYDVQFQWFTVSEMIETKFKNTYDMAVPCGYELCKLYQRGWLQKIDWQQLIPGLTNPMDLYAEPAQNAIRQMNSMLQKLDAIPDDFNVLDYGVPYFAQSFVFMYKGEELDFYSAIGNHEKITDRNPTWADIFYTISPQCNKYGDRFGEHTGMLDDSKSLYDISRIIETIEQDYVHPENATNEMPKNSSVDDLKETFKSLTSKARSNWYRLSTDSGQIARILADHSVHGYNAALSWSGDALYAAQGAGEYEPYTGDEMHTVKPAGVSLDEIDFIVINKKNEDNTKKLERIYKMIYDICLDAHEVDNEEELLKRVDNPYSLEDDRFKYWCMQNWDTVSYIPLLKNIYNFVSKTSSEYWSGDEKTRELMTSLIALPEDNVNSLFGRPLTALENSNTHWAWLETRGKL